MLFRKVSDPWPLVTQITAGSRGNTETQGSYEYLDLPGNNSIDNRSGYGDKVPEKGILSHTLFNDDAIKLVLFGFAPGQELTAHTAPMPATIQILSGNAEIMLGADTVEAAPDA